MSAIFFTIASRNYLAQVATLFESLQATHPDCPRYLCLVDHADSDLALSSLACEVVTIEALDLPNFDAFVFRYDILELNTAVKPYMFLWLQARHADQGIVYLDPDILVMDRMIEIEQAFSHGASIVLTPHLTAPMDDDRRPDELAILRSGTYNCGFVALNAHPSARRMLTWWAEKLEFDCVVDLPSGRFTDQKWIDLVPGMFPDVCILRDPGYNLAYWNLGQRSVSLRQGRWHVGDRPLAFVHFSGVDLERPELFSRHQNRFTIETIGALRTLYEDYLDRLVRNGHAQHRNKRYHWATFDDGELISGAHRRVYRRYHDTNGSDPVIAPRSMDRRVFDVSTDQVVNNAALPISRLMYELWSMREDLHHAFDLSDSEGREAFVRWFLRTASREFGIASRHTDAIRKRYETHTGTPTRPSHPRRLIGKFSRRVGSSSLALIDWTFRLPTFSRVYDFIPGKLKRRIRHQLERLSYAPLIASTGHAALDVEALEADGSAKTPAPGLNLTGYARGEFGVGEVLRTCADALQSAGFPFVIRDFEPGASSRSEDPRVEPHLSLTRPYLTNLFFINADQMEIARQHLGASTFEGHYNIAHWAWELERFPARWDSAFELVDEIWATSEHVRRAIQSRTDKPVFTLPVPIIVDPRSSPNRAEVGIDSSDFVLLTSFDFNSYIQRKNPGAVIQAFRLAFPRERSDVRLLVKTINGHRHAESLQQLRTETGNDPRIEIRDGFIDRKSMSAMQAACDGYVSLHRAEGFGLGMAECMALGKPVIATAYSGNLDFMDEENSRLVDFDLIPVREGEYPGWRNQHWADPHIEHAAMHMRELADRPAEARELGSRARTSIAASHSREVLIKFVQARLAQIHAQYPHQSCADIGAEHAG